MLKLFVEPLNIYRWKDIKSFLVRSQYNELLKLVAKEYFDFQYKNVELPRFLDPSRCLTLIRPNEGCNCEVRIGVGNAPASTGPNSMERLRQKMILAESAAKNAESQKNIDAQRLDFEWKNLEAQKPTLAIQPAQEADLEKLAKAISDKKDVKIGYDAAVLAINAGSGTPLKGALEALKKPVEAFEKSVSDAASVLTAFQSVKSEFDRNLREAQLHVTVATEQLNMANSNYLVDPSPDNEKKKRDAEIDLNYKKQIFAQTQEQYQLPTTEGCLDAETDYFCLPHFLYDRKQEITITNGLDFTFNTQGLTVGAVYWLYNYERMGIFKILGVLLDDYNYKGSYTISGNRTDSNGLNNRYSILMDLISTLHRNGISSNLRDRVCTYQRVLGVSIDNNLGIESERNTGLMQTFSLLNKYMLQYYADKRLAGAIQTGNAPRSSVATQTSILDTITLLKQQFEPFQYGRNQINTFLGIATVHATLCLLFMLRKEIGIPDQYETPSEFVQAAYESLILKRPAMINEKNRFTLYDNCASYGYRLFTDIELLDVKQFNISATDSSLTSFLDDSESKVEGLKNALESLPESADFFSNNQ